MFLVFQLVLFTKLQLGTVVTALEATEDVQVDSLLRGACRANQQHLAVRGGNNKNTYDHFKLMKKFTQWGDWECRSLNEVNCMESSCMVYSWIEKWNGTTKVSSDVEQITTLFLLYSLRGLVGAFWGRRRRNPLSPFASCLSGNDEKPCEGVRV